MDRANYYRWIQSDTDTCGPIGWHRPGTPVSRWQEAFDPKKAFTARNEARMELDHPLIVCMSINHPVNQ